MESRWHVGEMSSWMRHCWMTSPGKALSGIFAWKVSSSLPSLAQVKLGSSAAMTSSAQSSRTRRQ